VTTTDERPICDPCHAGRHEGCKHSVPTGRLVPDDDPYRDRTRMVPEWVACGCHTCRDECLTCRDVEHLTSAGEIFENIAGRLHMKTGSLRVHLTRHQHPELIR